MYGDLRDYVSIVRKVLKREDPVRHDGREIQLPYTGDGALGIGKPLKSILHTNPDIPIWLGTGHETNVKLTAEIADGWIPMGFVPGMMKVFEPWLDEGFRRAGGGTALARRDARRGARHRRYVCAVCVCVCDLLMIAVTHLVCDLLMTGTPNIFFTLCVIY